MFKNYKDICDVVSLIAYCASDKTFLVCKENNGEFWIPSMKSEKNSWKIAVQKLKLEVFGPDPPMCYPMRIYKLWMPNHIQRSVYHTVFKVTVRSELKKKTKSSRSRLQWVNSIDLERLRVHLSLRSPEVAVYSQWLVGEVPIDLGVPFNLEDGFLTEIAEDQVLVEEGAAGAAAVAATNYQLLQAAKYSRDDQIRMYKEFMVMVYPALYMSPQQFSQFVGELGFPKTECLILFRAADTSGRGGLSFLDLLLWMAAVEPGTPHSGVAAEVRCRYIFRYFDSNSDSKLEYVEFKELIAATRQMRQLPVDSLSVSRDTDLCLRQLGLQASSQLSLSEFLRAVGELRLRGTSSLLRSPKSISGYLADLLDRECFPSAITIAKHPNSEEIKELAEASKASAAGRLYSADKRQPLAWRQGGKTDYSLAAYTVKLTKKTQLDLIELKTFAEEAVSLSSLRLAGTGSLDALSPTAASSEALAAVRYFGSTFYKIPQRRRVNSSGSSEGVHTAAAAVGKGAWAWQTAAEEAALGALLLRLADAARPLFAAEPRLLRLAAPVYVVGDLHGNLGALLAMEAALWPSGPSLTPAHLLFLGDYVDRGQHGTELLAYLLAAKLQRPHGVFLVRGNHETRDIQKMFTFFGECTQKYGEVEGNRIWNAINLVFDVMPLAAVVDDKVFCCHGGIPPPWVCPLISAIDKVPVPLPRPAEQSSIAWELLWNDPIKPNKLTATLALELAANEGFAANAKRGTGHVFDQRALDRFLLDNRLSHVLRAHELQTAGFMCQLRGRLISVFSSSHYCGGTNDSGVVLLESGKVRLIRVCEDAKFN